MDPEALFTECESWGDPVAWPSVPSARSSASLRCSQTAPNRC
jgi:hypothetical protein